MIHTMVEDRRIRLSPPQEGFLLSSPERDAAPSGEASPADYVVRRLLAPDGKWREFLVLSAWTSMQATVWLNRRRRASLRCNAHGCRAKKGETAEADLRQR